MSQADALYHLQQLELAILRHQKRLKAIEESLGNHEQVAQAQKTLDSAAAHLKPLQTQARDLELQIQANRTKSKTAEERLYSGVVKNPKELQDLQSEIASLKKWHGELEDRLLEMMVAVEAAEAQMHSAEEGLEMVMKSLQKDHQDLLHEQKDLKTQVHDLLQKRKEALEKVTPESLSVYNQLKPRKANQAVSLMNARMCSVCGIEQTTIIEQEARKGERLVHCKNCERILVYRP